MGEQEKAGPLDFRKRGCVAAAELLQMPLLLRGTWDWDIWAKVLA